MHATARASALAFTFLVALAGCGGSGRHSLSGAVTYDGQPVLYGLITFAPDTTKGASGPQGSAEIRDGRYQTQGDKGPTLGPQVVRITCWKTAPEAGVLGAPLVNDYTVPVDVAADKQELDFHIPAVGKPKQK